VPVADVVPDALADAAAEVDGAAEAVGGADCDPAALPVDEPAGDADAAPDPDALAEARAEFEGDGVTEGVGVCDGVGVGETDMQPLALHEAHSQSDPTSAVLQKKPAAHGLLSL